EPSLALALVICELLLEPLDFGLLPPTAQQPFGGPMNARVAIVLVHAPYLGNHDLPIRVRRKLPEAQQQGSPRGDVGLHLQALGHSPRVRPERAEQMDEVTA